MIISDICTAYLHHKPTTTRHRQHVEALSRWFGHLTPKAITPTVIANWRSKRPNVQDSSIRRELGALLSVLNWGQRHAMVNVQDMPAIDLPPPGQAKQLWMTLQQEEEFWAASQGHGPDEDMLRLFVPLALDTAARKSAILSLTWDRVDLKAGLIDFRVPGMRKTNKRRIPVPINSRLRPVLEREEKFVVHASERVIKLRNIDKGFRRFATDLGLSWVTPHVCRHTWACLAAQAGMPMFHIAKMLGDTLKTVEDNYAHLAPSHLRDVADWRFKAA